MLCANVWVIIVLLLMSAVRHLFSHQEMLVGCRQSMIQDRVKLSVLCQLNSLKFTLALWASSVPQHQSFNFVRMKTCTVIIYGSKSLGRNIIIISGLLSQPKVILGGMARTFLHHVQYWAKFAKLCRKELVDDHVVFFAKLCHSLWPCFIYGNALFFFSHRH